MSHRPSRRFSKLRFPAQPVNPSTRYMINLPLRGRCLSSASGAVYPEPCKPDEELPFPPNSAPTWFSLSFPTLISVKMERATIACGTEWNLRPSEVYPFAGSPPPVGKAPIGPAYPLDHERLTTL